MIWEQHLITSWKLAVTAAKAVLLLLLPAVLLLLLPAVKAVLHFHKNNVIYKHLQTYFI